MTKTNDIQYLKCVYLYKPVTITLKVFFLNFKLILRLQS